MPYQEMALRTLLVATLMVFMPSPSHNMKIEDSGDLYPDLYANLEFELEQRFGATMESEPTAEMALLMDKRIYEYFEMVDRTMGLDQVRREKRSVSEATHQLPRDPKGVYRLSGLSEGFKIPTQYPVDLILFQHERRTYAAALESNPSSFGDKLVLYHLVKPKGFVAIDSKPTNRALDLDVHEIDGKLYLVVAEGDGENLDGGSKVYTVKDGLLHHEQTLSTVKPSDVEFWDLPGRHFLAVASAKYSPDLDRAIETDVKIIEWTANHFDVVQNITTTAAGSISLIQDNSTVFLAIAKYMDQAGNTDIDSEIWKYSLHEKKFVLHRRIRTHAAAHVKFFTVDQQVFLAIANRFESGVDGTPVFETYSVIYLLSDGDFVPFQSFKMEAVTRWEAYSGPNGEFVLFAVLYWQGLKAFQFDGWRFEEVSIKSLPYLHRDIVSLKAFSLNGSALLAVSNGKNGGNQPNVLKLEFSHDNPIEKHRDDYLQWCKQSLNTIENDNLKKVVNAFEKAPKWDSPVIVVNGDLEFQGGSTINKLTAGALKSEQVSMDSNYLQKLNELQALHNRQSAHLDEAATKVNLAVRREDFSNLHGGRLVANEVTVECPTNGCILGKTEADYLNGKNLNDFLNNVVDLDSDLTTKKPLRFSSVAVQGNLQSNKVAGLPVTSLVNRLTTKALHRPLVVTSQLSSPELTAGVVDGVVFSSENLLLLEGNQNLKFPLIGGAISVIELGVTGTINGLKLDVQSSPKPKLPEWTQPQELSSLTVNHLEVDDEFGGVLVRRLVANTLKTDQSYQELNSDYHLETVSAHNVDVSSLSGVAIQDLVDISDVVSLPGKLTSAAPISTSFLEVTQSLGTIPVVNGQLQVLTTKGTTSTNVVTGAKTIQKLVITDNVNIKGTILGLDLSATPISPVVEFNQPFDILGNVTVLSSVNVIKITINDILDSTGRLSLMQTLKNGVRLDNPELPAKLRFEGNFYVEKLVSEQINGVDTRYWIPNTLPEVQLTTTKTFSKGLSISGSSAINGLVSGVNLTDLDAQALKMEGYQVITGHKIVDSITVERAWSNDTRLGVLHWQDVLLITGGQTIPGLSHVNGTMIVKGSVAVTTLEVVGTISGITMNQLLNDTVFNDDKPYRITGPKTFLHGLEIASLSRLDEEPSTNTRLLPNLPEKHLNIRQPISVRNIIYGGKLNGVDKNSWNNWLLTIGDQTIMGVQDIQGYVAASAGVRIGNGFINQVNMTKLFSDAVRTDMPASLGHVSFEGGVCSYYPVRLGGLLSGLNISNALFLEPQLGLFEQTVVKPWSIGSLVVDETFNPASLVAGEKLGDLCDFASNKNALSPENLHITGSVVMDIEPFLDMINGHSLPDILNRIWLRDMASEIRRPIQLKKTLRLKGRVHSLDTVDGVKIKDIADSYFSLTKEAAISTFINFKGGVVAPNARLGSLKAKGLVNGKELSTFVSSVLRDGGLQEITGQFTFDGFHTSGNLSVLETVNGRNLSTAFMRKDQPNVMTRPIKVNASVKVEKLKMSTAIALGGVDFEMWFEKAVRKTGNYTIWGNRTLSKPQMSGGVRVSKLVNGVPFESTHLLLTVGEQSITGLTTIAKLNSRTALSIDHLELEGLLNGFPISDLIRRSAKKNGDIIFTGPMMFTAPLHAQSAEIAKLYHGVNISQLVLQAGSPVELKEFRQASEQLLRTASRAVLSLKSHAFYLNTFRLAQTFDEAKYIFPMTAHNDPVAQLIVVQSSNGDDVISRFIYDDSLETIVPIQERRETFPSSVYLIQPILWQNCNAFYWEGKFYEESGTVPFVGHIIALNSSGSFGLATVLRSRNKAEWAYSLNLGGRSCLIRGAHRYGAILELFCSKTLFDLDLVQTLDIPSPTQAAHLLVNGEDHVFVTCNSDEYTEGTVAVLRWDSNTGMLNLIQTFPVLNATAVDAISYSGAHFVAVASGRLDMKPHPGMVDISRYDPSLRSYNHWLSLEVEAPTLVKFAILPSDELVLYVLTEQPTKSFVAFLYRGLAGFQEHASVALSLGDTLTVMQTVGYRHLVSVSNTHGGKAVLLRANFKGVKYNNNVKSGLNRQPRKA